MISGDSRVACRKLSDEISEEGAKEAFQYDKYACFCKDQAEYKTNAIAKSVRFFAFNDKWPLVVM